MRIDAVRDNSLNGWLIGPVGNLVNFLADGMAIAGVTHRALMALSGMPLIMAAAKDRLPNAASRQAMQRLIEFTRDDAKFAKKEVDNGFTTVSSYHAVSAWAAVETTIEQTLANLIRNVDAAEAIILRDAPTLKVSKTTFEQAKRTCRNWEGTLQGLDTTMDRTLHMLAAFGLRVTLDGNNQQLLSELAELRNVIMHRAGFVDQQFKNKCPWRQEKEGDLVHIDRPALGKYFDAAFDFQKSCCWRSPPAHTSRP